MKNKIILIISCAILLLSAAIIIINGFVVNLPDHIVRTFGILALAGIALLSYSYVTWWNQKHKS